MPFVLGDSSKPDPRPAARAAFRKMRTFLLLALLATVVAESLHGAQPEALGGKHPEALDAFKSLAQDSQSCDTCIQARKNASRLPLVTRRGTCTWL